MMAKVKEIDKERSAILYHNYLTNKEVETSILRGKCKLQWKVDWAMRWVALGVDYEMAGKDLIESVNLSGKICRALGKNPPEGFNYELFLDENGEKISKSKGNGITINEWLKYANPESLSLYIEVMMADLNVVEESIRFLELLGETLQLNNLEISSIKHTMKFKYQDI